MARRLAVPGEDFYTSFIDQLYVEAQDAYIGGEDIWVGRQLSRFNDQVVVDCGAGPRGYGYILAERFGAKAYIAVEPHHSEALGNDVLRIQSSGWDRTIPVAIVPSDMRAALSRIPSDSSSILLFGIDFSVVGSEDYFADCSEKIGHVLHPNGVLAIGCLLYTSPSPRDH